MILVFLTKICLLDENLSFGRKFVFLRKICLFDRISFELLSLKTVTLGYEPKYLVGSTYQPT